MKTSSILVVALVAAIWGTAVAQSASSNTLLISPGDALHISVLDMPEMEQTPRVTDVGDIPVVGIGSVRVANMTPAEAATAIHDRFVSTHYLNHPQVSVVVDQYATQEVTLIGEVRTPGAYPIATPRPTTALGPMRVPLPISAWGPTTTPGASTTPGSSLALGSIWHS